jgi:Zn-dependent protease with chaperone function
MFELLGISLALAALLSVNALASMASTLLWQAIKARAQLRTAAERAQILLALRLLPGFMATAVVVVFLIPAYIVYEPRQTAEKVSFKLAAIAALSAAGLLLAGWRGFSTWLATRRLVGSWLSHSRPIRLNEVSIPSYRLRHPFPVVAVVGVFRPRLFIADRLFDSLNRKEIAAAVAHECGHLAAKDNLKRTLMRICRNLLTVIPCGRELDCAWTEASEAAADEYAVQRGGQSALDMAAALTKIARMAPRGMTPVTPLNASLIGDNVSLIAWRVERLTHMVIPDDARRKQRPVAGNPLPWICFTSVLAAIALLALTPNALSKAHGWIEIVVATLQ